MSPTVACMYVHVIFATKDHAPWIEPDWRQRLYDFLGAQIADRDAVALSIGGIEDHVHLLLRLKPLHCVADLVREVKVLSSKWIHEQQLEPDFAWQEGYGVFSVSPNAVEAVVHYIDTQEEHHRERSTAEEFHAFLHKTVVVAR